MEENRERSKPTPQTWQTWQAAQTHVNHRCDTLEKEPYENANDNNLHTTKTAAAICSTTRSGRTKEAPATNEQRRQRRLKLLRDASCHGPFLWTGKDVTNALLWFDDPHKHDDSGSDGGDRQEQRRQFLKRILASRGLFLQQGYDYDSSVDSTKTPIKNDSSCSSRTRKRRKRDLADLCQTVVSGYLEHDQETPSSSSPLHAALPELIQHVTQLAVQRRMTGYLLHDSLNQSCTTCGPTVDATTTTSSKETPRLHPYLYHAQAVSNRAYAAQLYSRYLHLYQNQVGSESVGSKEDIENVSLAETFLANLNQLAETEFRQICKKHHHHPLDDSFQQDQSGLLKIREVQLLMLLEPPRRAYATSKQDSSLLSTFSLLPFEARYDEACTQEAVVHLCSFLTQSLAVYCIRENPLSRTAAKGVIVTQDLVLRLLPSALIHAVCHYYLPIAEWYVSSLLNNLLQMPPPRSDQSQHQHQYQDDHDAGTKHWREQRLVQLALTSPRLGEFVQNVIQSKMKSIHQKEQAQDLVGKERLACVVARLHQAFSAGKECN